MGGCSATLTSSSVVDGRPDRPSRGRWRIVPDVCRECSLKSIHCSKVHDSYLSRTPRPDKFTRPSVRTRRGNHPAPSGRPPRGGAKVTWFRYSCEYRRYSRDDPGDLTTDQCAKHVNHGAKPERRMFHLAILAVRSPLTLSEPRTAKMARWIISVLALTSPGPLRPPADDLPPR